MTKEVWKQDDIHKLFQVLSKSMTEHRDMLIAMDSEIGDGDLGITMKKAFTAAAELLPSVEEHLPGKVFIEAGKIIAKNAPSTMGTLMATGFMYGGKAIGEEEFINGKSLQVFFKGFLDGVVKRGKAKPGDKTLIDVLDSVVTHLDEENEGDLAAALFAAGKASSEGLEATKGMISQHGKAAIYREQTLGKVDPGAAAMDLVVQGFISAFYE